MTLSLATNWTIYAGAAYLVLALGHSADSTSPSRTKAISKSAAQSCDLKVKRLEAYAANSNPSEGQTTRFSENEINSYMAIELSPKYHASLKSISVSLEESKLQGVAAIDFNHVNVSSSKILTKLLVKMFAGVHNLTVRGKLLATEGKASFQLQEAQFDGITLPNFLVEEIISAVGRKQKPPFDPLKPSEMPFGIKSVDLHAGYILVHQ